MLSKLLLRLSHWNLGRKESRNYQITLSVPALSSLGKIWSKVFPFVAICLWPWKSDTTQGPEMKNNLAMHKTSREMKKELGVSLLPDSVLQGREQTRFQNKALR